MEVTVSTTQSDRQRTGCLVLGVHEGRRLSASARLIDEASSGLLSRLLRTTPFRGRVGQILMLHHVPGAVTEQVLLVGCGRRGQLDADGYRRALRTAFESLTSAGVRSATAYLTEIEVDGGDAAWRARQATVAVHESAYRFNAPRREPPSDGAVALRHLVLGVESRAVLREAREAVRQGNAIGVGLTLAQDLGNLPGNRCTPTHLAEQARRLARGHASIKVSVRGAAEMKRLGMGALLGVAQGSSEPPRLIAIEYSGGRKGHKPVVIVGKGVTFDSGGISIKPAQAMDEMKFDMCGAASVLGTLAAAAEMQLARNIVGIVPATENLPSSSALKPGDVLTSMSGRTVEILNTDAEGRLILCDALTFAKRYDPEVVIDVATLTGACVIALGAPATGLFANDDALADGLLQAGETSGDRAWRMPLWKEYEEQLRSNFADLANVGGREAGAVTAACFLGRFAEEYRWAHLDIAGTAWRSGKPKGATGRPVRLLCQYLIDSIPKRRRPEPAA
jgi:leucyl aminopeptidase